MVVGEGFEPPKGWARQIYSLHPLAAWLPHQIRYITTEPLKKQIYISLPSLFSRKRKIYLILGRAYHYLSSISNNYKFFNVS